MRGAAAEGERRRRAAWKERARGARSAAGDTGQRGKRQVAQRGEGYRAFGSTSGGSIPAQSSRDADREMGRKRLVRLETEGDGSRSVCERAGVLRSFMLRERRCGGGNRSRHKKMKQFGREIHRVVNSQVTSFQSYCNRVGDLRLTW